MIFEGYLDLMGSLSSSAALRTWRRVHPGTMMPRSKAEDIFKREKGSFHGFILMACGNINTGARRQRFYTTFAARYHGLSRGGLRILAYFGMAIKMTTYDIMQADRLNEQHEKTR